MKKIGLLLMLSFLITNCSTSDEVREGGSVSQLSAEALSQKEAERRSQILSDVKYNLFVDVTGGAKNFAGEQQMTFVLNRREDVWVDFQEGVITEAIVNGKSLKLERGPVHVKLPKANLVVGENLVIMRFTHEYSRSGSGLHRFQDPEDKKVYLYTDFEPFDASRWAPFFDQPDIKAPLTLTVEAPVHWVVSANTLETRIDKKEKTATWYFAPTAPISTYIYAMVAGPFVVWQDKYKDVPLRIFARKSLARYIPQEEWFHVTKKGFEYFERYFAVPYPFGKYDQLIVPEFNSGAMENVGAVTFSERYIQRGGYSRSERNRIASVVLHEMAHMWFGNLVTMKWWNDLWLNESFATYMSSLAQDDATVFSEVWADFRVDKAGAYNLDQTIVTHPISAVVRNTDEAFTNFDDITYDKGASVMKELSQYVGAEVFKKSLQLYFKKHSYKNTTLNDFIGAFEETTKENMDDWFQSWLETTGVDTARQSYTCSTKKVQGKNVGVLNIEIAMSKKSRPHAFKVGAYKLRGDGQVVRLLSADMKTKVGDDGVDVELQMADDKSCPDFIYANYQDHAYFKVEFDEKSLAFLLNNIDAVKNPELRLSIWADLWEMVRDQKLKVSHFSEMALRSLAVEQDITVLSYLVQKTMGSAGGDFETVYYYWPQTFEQDRVTLKQVTKGYEQIFWSRMNEAKESSAKFAQQLAKQKAKYKIAQKERERKEFIAFKRSGEKGEFKFTPQFKVFENPYEDHYKLFFDAYLVAVNSTRGVENTLSLLKQTNDPDRRWRVLYALCRENHTNVESLITSELKRDKSDVAVKSALACRVVRPVHEQKAAYVKSLTTSDKISYSADEISRIGRHLFPPKQREMLTYFKADVYQALKNYWPKLEGPFQSRLAGGLAPAYCNSDANTELQKFVDDSGAGLPASIKKPLLTRLDADRRCIAVRKFNRD